MVYKILSKSLITMDPHEKYPMRGKTSGSLSRPIQPYFCKTLAKHLAGLVRENNSQLLSGRGRNKRSENNNQSCSRAKDHTWMAIERAYK